MPRKVFFSFHFQRDAWRVSQVRNSDVVTRRFEKSRYLDKAAWEEVERKGVKSIQNWIDSNLLGTSVAVILIGNETNTRPWVHYEIQKSWNEGKGILGVKIHGIKNQHGNTDYEGDNPFRYYYYDSDGQLIKREEGEDEWFGLGVFAPEGKNLLSDSLKTYDWIDDDGRQNIGDWIEAAAKQAGR